MPFWHVPYFLCPISRDYASFYITIQPRLTIFGLHIDHGGYMPEGHVSLNNSKCIDQLWRANKFYRNGETDPITKT
jgi:hypothetical protein